MTFYIQLQPVILQRKEEEKRKSEGKLNQKFFGECKHLLSTHRPTACVADDTVEYCNIVEGTPLCLNGYPNILQFTWLSIHNVIQDNPPRKLSCCVT